MAGDPNGNFDGDGLELRGLLRSSLRVRGGRLSRNASFYRPERSECGRVSHKDQPSFAPRVSAVEIQRRFR